MNQPSSSSENHLNQARASLQQTLSWYSKFRRHGNHLPNEELQSAVRHDLQSLKLALEKLDHKVIKIATFGLVSRGKSTVINALLEQKLLSTGPLHGVTKSPQSVNWTPPGSQIQIELIDTPGLDEISGEARAKMAQEVAQQADLILFVVAGDITRTEYQALCKLRQKQKPLILVFNKIDLYPEQDREKIYQQLLQLGSGNLHEILSPEEIVLVAAQPQPIAMHLEWQDGQVIEEWENLPPQIDALRQKILDVLNREGLSLLAINALFQGRNAELNLAAKTLRLRQEEAETIIWKYAKYKALAVAINPIAILDILAGACTDLALIRSLASLYGLPITNFEMVKLWQKILLSSGGLILGEIGTSLLLGIGKTTSAVAVWENPAAVTTFASAAITQGGIAGYGAYIVGKATQEYLQRGCSWEPMGPSTVIQEILNQVEPQAILYRLRQELEQKLGQKTNPLA